MATLSAPTLTTLLGEVRLLLNQTSATNSNWTDAELTQYINEAIRRYFAEVVQVNEGQFSAQTDLNIVTDTDTISLPADFFKVIRLYKKVSQGYEILSYRNHFDEGYSTQGGTSSNNYAPYYYFRDNSLVLRPIPNFSETAGLRLEYIQFPEVLVSGSDTMDVGISAAFRDLVVMYAVWKAKLKESLVNGVDTSALAKASVADMYQAFREAMTPRSENPTAIKPFVPENW